MALHHSGRSDREPLPRRQLLSLARDGTCRGSAAAAEVRQVPAHRDRDLLRGLGDTAIDHRDGLRAPGDGRIGTPRSRLSRRHVRQEHRREYPDPHDLHELPALSPDGEGRHGAVGKNGSCGAAHDLRRRGDLRHLSRRLRVLCRGECQDWPVGAPGRFGSVRDGGHHRDRHLPLPRGEDGRGTLGKGPGQLPVRADFHRGHVHLADGTHGLRSLRAPPALARLRRHPGQLARRFHAHPRLRDAGRLGDRAHLLLPDRLRILAREPARASRASGKCAITPERAAHGRGRGSRWRAPRRAERRGAHRAVMTIPLVARIGVLVLATTAFYGYVGQMVPQSEVQPPEEIAIRADLTTPEMVEIGREIADGKGLCRTCHTIGQSGALRFTDLAGVAGRAAERVQGLSALDYLAQSLYEPDAFVVPGFNPGMPTINRPPIGLTDQEILCVIAYLESLGGTPTVTLQTSHRYYAAPAAPGAAPPDAAAGAPVTTPAGPGPTPPTPGTTPAVPGATPDQKPEPGERLPLTGRPPQAAPRPPPAGGVTR